jgi:hypothetical protein
MSAHIDRVKAIEFAGPDMVPVDLVDPHRDAYGTRDPQTVPSPRRGVLRLRVVPTTGLRPGG